MGSIKVSLLMIRLVKSKSNHPDLISLVKELDAYLKVTDGEDHEFYNQFNGLENIDHCLIAYHNEEPVGCGALKRIDDETAEIKRMYLRPNYRGKGIANSIIFELEKWAKSLGYHRLILETGDRQIAAVKFYCKMGYQKISNYGPYLEMENSNCFEKFI